MRVHFTRSSANAKTGPMPVTTTERASCPDSCAYKNNGCYAESGPLRLHWNKVSDGRADAEWHQTMAKIKALPDGTLWRHNQAGDLPGHGDAIDAIKLRELILANKGRKGFTYTHKPLNRANAFLIQEANDNGFTVNLSANDLSHADELAETGLPVCVVLPEDQMTATETPNGRKVAICPAVLSDDVSCASCGVCQLKDRKAIIGFPAHGTGKRKASAIAAG